MSKLLRGLIAAVAFTVVAACGPVHAGQAAVVGETEISMREANDAAEAYCKLTLLEASQQGIEEILNAQLRRQAVADLIVAEVANQVAERDGLVIPQVQVTQAELTQINEVLPDDVDQVVATLERGRLLTSLAIQLGALAGGTSALNLAEAELYELGRQVLDREVAQAEVAVDPRFGLDADGIPVSDSGSLSVATQLPVTDPTDTADAPDPLLCQA